MARSDSNTGASFTIAHIVIGVYIGLAVIALLLLGSPLPRAGDSLAVLGARYSSLLMTVVPFLTIAALWTTGLSVIRRARPGIHELEANSGITGFTNDEPANTTRRPAAVGIWATISRAPLLPLPFEGDVQLPGEDKDAGASQPSRASTAVQQPIVIAASGALSPVTVTAVAVVFGLNSGMLLFYLVFSLLVLAAAAGAARRLASVNTPAPHAAVQMKNCIELLSSELYHRMRYAILGLLIAAALHVLMPAQLVTFFSGAPVVAALGAAALGLVIPLPAEAAPFAAALFLSSAGHGAAFAFLLVSAFGGLRLTRTALQSREALLFMISILLLVTLLSAPLTARATGALW